MVEQTMRAAYVAALGAAETITVGRLPAPNPGPNDVLVGVDTVAVNLADTFVRSGSFATPTPMPYIIGTDLVGTVVDVGSEALAFRRGQRVWCNSMGRDGRQGPTAEYAAVPVERLYHLPDGVDQQTAVALAQPAATAYLAWFVHARLRPGETVFVGGGAGNVGTAAIQLARLAGARVIASARPDDHDKCRVAGAEAVFDFTDSALPDRVADYAGQDVDVVWETSGHHDFSLVKHVAAVGCRVIVTAVSGAPSVPLPQLYPRDVSVLGFVISRAAVADLAGAAALINQLLAAGRLSTHIGECLPLARAAEAHQRIEDATVAGRLLLAV